MELHRKYDEVKLHPASACLSLAPNMNRGSRVVPLSLEQPSPPSSNDSIVGSALWHRMDQRNTKHTKHVCNKIKGLETHNVAQVYIHCRCSAFDFIVHEGARQECYER